MDEDFSRGWQARAGARKLANALEVQLRREEAERDISEPLAVGRYLIRSRGYAAKTQFDLCQAAGVSQSMMSRLERAKASMTPFDNFLKGVSVLGRLFPMCCWPPG